MRRDHRPYWLKRLDLTLQHLYVRHFLAPQFAFLGQGYQFMKPWHVEVFGGPIGLGDYANVIATPDKKVRLTVWSTLEGEGRITIGRYSLICPGVRISAARDITVGDSCMLAQGALVTDADWHGIYDRSLSVGQTAPVVIEDNVWIGDSAMVFKGVTIGRNSIIGAGSVVLRDIPANCVAAGNPAAVVKTLDVRQPMKTRREWFKDPLALAAEFSLLDRQFLRHNHLLGWLRSLIFPSAGD
jgi:acetyltransferase-like isoleucine patch superfamily enzyme